MNPPDLDTLKADLRAFLEPVVALVGTDGARGELAARRAQALPARIALAVGAEPGEALATLLEDAAGDRGAFRALCVLAADLREADLPVPGPLKSFEVALLREEIPVPPAPRGVSRDGTAVRDARIVWAVCMAQDRGATAYGACELVREALAGLGCHLTREAVQRVWERSPLAQHERGTGGGSH